MRSMRPGTCGDVTAVPRRPWAARPAPPRRPRTPTAFATLNRPEQRQRDGVTSLRRHEGEACAFRVHAHVARVDVCGARPADHLLSNGPNAGRRHLARDVRVDAKGARFTLVTTKGSHPVTLPLLGRSTSRMRGRRGLRGGAGRAAQGVANGCPRRRRSGSHGAHRRRSLRSCCATTPTPPMPWSGPLETVREVTSSAGRVIVVFGAGGGPRSRQTGAHGRDRRTPGGHRHCDVRQPADPRIRRRFSTTWRPGWRNASTIGRGSPAPPSARRSSCARR